MSGVIADIFGITREAFVSDYLGVRPLFAANVANRTMSMMPDGTQLNELLSLFGAYPDSVRMARNGQVHASPRLKSSGRLDVESVWSQYQRGSSLVLNSVFIVDAGCKSICEHLLGALGHRVQANIYITPPQEQAFATHFDPHDVIAVQLHGSKTWEVFEPSERIQKWPRIQDPSLQPSDLESGTRSEFRLLRGSALYLPRGFPHKAHSELSPSIHITFSLDPISVGEVLRTALHILEDSEEDLRQHVSADMFQPRSSTTIGETLDLLKAALANPRVISTALQNIRKQILQGITLTPAGTLETTFQSNATIRLRDHVYYDVLKRSPDRMTLTNGLKETSLSEAQLDIILLLEKERQAKVVEVQRRWGDDASELMLKLNALGLAEIVAADD